MMRVCDMTYVKINALIWQCNVLDQTICIPSCLLVFVGLTSRVDNSFTCRDGFRIS